jgi:hypothetical protein
VGMEGDQVPWMKYLVPPSAMHLSLSNTQYTCTINNCEPISQYYTCICKHTCLLNAERESRISCSMSAASCERLETACKLQRSSVNFSQKEWVTKAHPVYCTLDAPPPAILTWRHLSTLSTPPYVVAPCAQLTLGSKQSTPAMARRACEKAVCSRGEV